MKHILVPVDFSDLTARVVEQAVALARLAGAQVTLLHVVPAEPEFVGYEPGPDSVRDAVAHRFANEHRRLQALEQGLMSAGVSARALLIQGYASEKILSEAAKLGADMIIMGSHGHSALRNLLVGSVAEGVLRKAACPVVIVPIGR